MNHLKLFENKKEGFWLVSYVSKNLTDFTLYKDRESAENDIISTINEEKEELIHSIGEKYTDDDIFTDVNKAMEWHENRFSDVRLNYEKIYLSKPFELDDKIKILKKTRKFNL